MGALSLEPSHQQGMQRSYETYSNRSFARVDLHAAMFPFPSCIVVDSSAQAASVSRTMRETSWDVEQTRNRLPFLAKTTFQT